MTSKGQLYMADSEKVRKRKEKFSDEVRSRILNDPLNDGALLSRLEGIHGNIRVLQTDQEARIRFFKRILDIRKLDPESDQIAYGLRKLREIIISVYNLNKNDSSFVAFILKVFDVSVKYHVDRNEISKTLPSLQFVIETPELREFGSRYEELVGCYILYTSHIDLNVEKSIQLSSKLLVNSSYRNTCKRLALIYCCRSEPFSFWFSTVAQLSDSSLMKTFLIALPAFEYIKEQTIVTISKCYNQLGLTFMEVGWFHNMFQNLEETVAKRWVVEQTIRSGKIVKFKQRIN